jgi:hypothetical protein
MTTWGEADTPSDGPLVQVLRHSQGEVCAMMDESRFSIYPLLFTANSAVPGL